MPGGVIRSLISPDYRIILALLGRRSEGTGTLRWIIEETRRRLRLNAEDYCDTYLLSYPRSGNHAVRFAMEWISRRPTLGADDHESLKRPRGLHDLPLFLRGGGPAVSSLAPIAIKRHSMKPTDSLGRLIFIERDPVEAILSHNVRLGHCSEEALWAGLVDWKRQRTFYDNFVGDQKLLIKFDDVAGGGWAWIKQLVEFLGLKVPASEVRLCAESMPDARGLLLRRPQSTSRTSFREKFPERAQKIDSALEGF
jgi:hypothetical protein